MLLLFTSATHARHSFDANTESERHLFLGFGEMSGLKLARNASRLDLEKEVLFVSISDARSHPLAPTLTSRFRVGPQCTRLHERMSRCCTYLAHFREPLDWQRTVESLLSELGSCNHRDIRSSRHHINSSGVRSHEKRILISRIKCQRPNPLAG